MLAHFYTFEHFMDVGLDHYVKRFVREYIHYRDEVQLPLTFTLPHRRTQATAMCKSSLQTYKSG